MCERQSERDPTDNGIIDGIVGSESPAFLRGGWGESQPFCRLLTADSASRQKRAQALMDYPMIGEPW